MARCVICTSSPVQRCSDGVMDHSRRCVNTGMLPTSSGSGNECRYRGRASGTGVWSTAMRLFSAMAVIWAFGQQAWAQEDAKIAAEALLDEFHLAAAEGDGERYFSLFSDDAVFHGTDITERWTKAEFQEYAMPHFGDGHGWTYVPQTRYTYISEDGNTAWFDETLLNDNFGLTRGTGVLVLTESGWKLAQYHLTLPVPNDLIRNLVKMIEDQE